MGGYVSDVIIIICSCHFTVMSINVLSGWVIKTYHALWHGPWSGFFIHFSIQFIVSAAERQVIKA